MSKIAEKKVRELGYNKDIFNRAEYTANDVFDAAVECYDQAMQDFLEKACEWLSKQPMSSPVFWTVEDFKNYMEEEL